MAFAPLVQIVELGNGTGQQMRFTVADGTQISKGILLKFATPRTASQGAKADVFAGVSMMEKEASDGSTSITVLYADAVIDVRASGAIVGGDRVMMAGQNEVMTTTVVSGAVLTTGIVVGTALKTAIDQDVINVRLER